MNEQALTQTKQPMTLMHRLQSDRFKLEVARALPKHLTPDRFVRVALTTTMRTPLLQHCDEASVLNAMMTLSQLGIEPDGRRAHLIPFRNNKRNCYECQLIIDYKGLAELAMRSGVVSNLHADVVRELDEFEFDRGSVTKHRIDFRKPRGDIYAVYALCRFKDGSEKCEVMSTDEVESIRKRSRAGNSGPWVTDWAEMAKKTCFRRLSKWLPLSPEFRDAVERDDDTIDIESAPVAPKELPAFVPPPDAPKRRGRPPKQQTQTPAPETEVSNEQEPASPLGESAEPGELAPEPLPEPVADAHAELIDWLSENNISFDRLRAALSDLGWINDADSVAGVDELQEKIVRRCLNSKAGLIKTFKQ